MLTRLKRRIKSAVLSRLGATTEVRVVEAPRYDRYDHLMSTFRSVDPASMIEIGVWRGDRAALFMADGKRLKRYVGFDLFEGMTDEVYTAESMGNCVPHSKEWVQQQLAPHATPRDIAVELVAGPTERTLTAFAREHPEEFDFIYLDGGHSLETVANDWAASSRLIRPGGVVVFDDYYVNDASRGAKPLIDSLLADRRYRVRFFPMVEDIIEDLQITMVAVTRLS